jgi:hypothetical protein
MVSKCVESLMGMIYFVIRSNEWIYIQEMTDDQLEF